MIKREETPLHHILICLVLQVVISLSAFTCFYSLIPLKFIFLLFFLEGSMLLIFNKYSKNSSWSRTTMVLGVFIFMTLLLTCTYYSNILGDTDLDFNTFQQDSEVLVEGAITAAQSGIRSTKYGLGWYHTDSQSFETYSANLGLQGYVFGMLGRNMRFSQAENVMHLLCSYSAAAVFAFIVLLLRKKYDLLMAGCFFVTFFLSVWVVNFARNLYWVEFTWFIPMCFGLFFSVFGHKKWCAAIAYVGVFLSILIKCLCGYEYITCIMMAMIAFPFLDLVDLVLCKDWKAVTVQLKKVFLLGVLALMGFAVALIIHSYRRGEGSIAQGLMETYERDILRRVSTNVDPLMFDESYAESFYASVLDVLQKYLHFSTDIIYGLDGKLFPVLGLLPVLFFVIRFTKKRLEWNDVTLYLMFLTTCISWYILAKPHSYFHTHISFVLWYFGFVQICFYLICKYIISALKERKHK